MAPSDTTMDPEDLRTQVVAASIQLFSSGGYESTTVDQIAAAAGVSRRTLFRQFRSKEDMIFADHEILLERVAEHLSAGEFGAQPAAPESPWTMVCDAAEIVFTHYVTMRELAVARLRVVQQVPALRERELVTTYRYQRVFEEFLRRTLPAESPVHIVAFAAAVTAAHNYLLRAMIRGDSGATLEALRSELGYIRVALGAGRWGSEASDTQVAVLSFPAGAAPGDVGEAVAQHLRETAHEQRQ